MNDQEKQIIADIFQRLEQTAKQTRDPEAERLIAEKVRAQPYAPYAMAQALYVQEEALKSLNEQLDQAKAENEHLRQQGSSGGGILSSIFGGGQRPQPAASFARQQPQGVGPQQGGPWGGQPQGGYQQQPQQGGPSAGQQQAPGGGGFLRGALTTAAGVAGGMVVGNALMSAFSGGHHSTLGSLSNADMSSMGFGDALGGSSGGGVQDASFSDGGGVFGNSGSTQDASFSDGGSIFGDSGSAQDAGFEGGGVDFGGGSDSWT